MNLTLIERIKSLVEGLYNQGYGDGMSRLIEDLKGEILDDFLGRNTARAIIKRDIYRAQLETRESTTGFQVSPEFLVEAIEELWEAGYDAGQASYPLPDRDWIRDQIDDMYGSQVTLSRGDFENRVEAMFKRWRNRQSSIL